MARIPDMRIVAGLEVTPEEPSKKNKFEIIFLIATKLGGSILMSRAHYYNQVNYTQNSNILHLFLSHFEAHF